jgi:guanyl-specific ribonuclease Sa
MRPLPAAMRHVPVIALAALGSLSFFTCGPPRTEERSAAGERSASPAASVTPSARPDGSRETGAHAPRSRALRSLGDPALDGQVARVVESLETTGRPPAGVAQGGRRGRTSGLFENAEGRLPPQPRGYYTETDVWPRTVAGRGAERLIVGRQGEVYYTADHYRTFERLR